MTRISTASQQSALLAELQKQTERTNKSQLQISTGKIAQQYKEIAPQTEVLLSAKSLKTRTESYQSTNKEIANRLNLQDVSLSQLATTAKDLQSSILDGMSLGSGLTFMEQVGSAFQQALSILNTQVNGVYIYGGTKTDQPPVTASTLSDLQAAPTAASVFQNNSERIGIEIDKGQTLQYNFLADQVGGALMDTIKQIADYNAGAGGPFGATLTDAQKTFLQGQVQNLSTIMQDLNQVVAQNGQYQNVVDDADTRHSQTVINVTGFISDIEDADVAQAVSNLNLDQTTLQATAKLIANLKTDSLLNYLN